MCDVFALRAVVVVTITIIHIPYYIDCRIANQTKQNVGRNKAMNSLYYYRTLHFVNTLLPNRKQIPLR